MSACIIHVDIIIRCINEDMGRLRFTLANVILWITLILSVLLSENFAVFNTDPMKGFAIAPGYLLCGVIILFLVFYYVLEHKKNGL